MDKFYKLSLGLAILLALSFVALADPAPEVAEEVDTRPVLEVEVNGKRYRAPLYADVELSQKRRDFDVKTIDTLFKIIKNCVELIVGNNSYFSLISPLSSLVTKVPGMFSDLNKLRKTDTDSPPMDPRYAGKMGDLVQGMTDSTSNEVLTRKQIKDRTDDLLSAIKLMVEKSKAGLYMDYNKFTIDGVLLNDHVAPILNWLRQNGYNKVISVMKTVASMLRNHNKDKLKKQGL